MSTPGIDVALAIVRGHVLPIGNDITYGRGWEDARASIERDIIAAARLTPAGPPTWAHTAANDPNGFYDDNWEPRTGAGEAGMSNFVLTVLPDGPALLTTERDLTNEQLVAVRDAFEEWRRTEHGVAVIANCRTQHAASVEIDLPATGDDLYRQGWLAGNAHADAEHNAAGDP